MQTISTQEEIDESQPLFTELFTTLEVELSDKQIASLIVITLNRDYTFIPTQVDSSDGRLVWYVAAGHPEIVGAKVKLLGISPIYRPYHLVVGSRVGIFATNKENLLPWYTSTILALSVLYK